MITSPLIFHISPQWKQSDTNSSINKQQKLTIKHLYKSKGPDAWFNQSTFDHHKDTSGNSGLMYLNQTSKKIKGLFLNSNLDKKNNRRYITINLSRNENNDQNFKTAKDLNQILNDIQTYRNQLHDTHGSIHIQAYSSQSKRCCCNHNQSTEICKQISKFENELFQNDFVEYIYKIEGTSNGTV